MKSIRLKILAGLLLAWPTALPATDRWEALGMIESGNCDRCTGRAGELSRYQIMPENWRASASGGESFTNHWQALSVAMRIQGRRVAVFAQNHGRLPTDREWYLLWHRPARMMGKSRCQINATDLHLAERFENLIRANDQAQQPGEKMKD